ncbi:MAG: hypothetical protein QOK15_829 [Nocardioidaceae bacterium]|jgi:hypothetical protein|nr:hypothetical protein [Nocardioidaceae bacterium]
MTGLSARRLLTAGLALVSAVAGGLTLGAASLTSADATMRSPAPSIVGRWQQSHTCDELVRGLDALGLEALAPGVVGDYFPDQSPAALAAKPDICAGATPQLHSHFFTASGLFGSLDQFSNQVDDGTYVIVDSNTFRIGDATFDYRIHGGLVALTPVITAQQRRAALRHPWQFSTAGWMVAVAYPGTLWNHVACRGWC